MKTRVTLVSLLGSVASLLLWTLLPVSGGERGSDMKTDSTKVTKSNTEWKKILTPQEYKILRKKGTERAGTGKYNHHKETGTYTCAGCGSALFQSSDKYDSGCGWPSFTSPASDDAVSEKPDRGLGRTRTEVLCPNCDGHLGHVFSDGPKPTGRHYCINSVALDFVKGQADEKKTDPALETATLGTGCFWCTEAVFEQINGVKSAKSGYSGGRTPNPSYKEVCSGHTGHAEVVQVQYDPGLVSFRTLLTTFWKMHDPTSLNRQGADIGSQYRSAIFYHSPEQKTVAEDYKAELEKDKTYGKPIVTEITAFNSFTEAENYHQNYYQNNRSQPYCKRIIEPKLKKLGMKQEPRLRRKPLTQ